MGEIFYEFIRARPSDKGMVNGGYRECGSLMSGYLEDTQYVPGTGTEIE